MEQELESLYAALDTAEEKDEHGVIHDKALKQRVGRFCLEMLRKTPDEEEARQSTAYTIAGFMRYMFDDSFEDITSLAGELELPSAHISGDPKQLWGELEKALEAYCA